MRTHKIHLDRIDPDKENITHTYNLLKNSILTKLEFYTNTQQAYPEWVKKLKDQRWQKININPELIFLLSNKLIKFEWEELHEKIYLNLSLLASYADNTDKEIISYYNKSCEIKDNFVKPWTHARQEVNTMFLEAMKILEETWVEAYALVNAFVKKIVLVESPNFFSGSLPRYQGAILVSPKPHWQLAHFIECLVHEASHLDLNIRRMIEPFLRNADECAYSALRRETRPLPGILHAAFVLCRTTDSLKKLTLRSSYSTEAHELLSDYMPALENTLEVLERYAQFTSTGEKLFSQMRQKAKNHEVSI